jgi:hypothetical protein
MGNHNGRFFVFVFIENKKSFQSVRVNNLMPNSLLIKVDDKNPRDRIKIFTAEVA